MLALKKKKKKKQQLRNSSIFALPSTSLWGVYSETFIHRYNIPLTYAFTRLCIKKFPHMYILHYASYPWSPCAQFSFLGFSQLNISEPGLIFKYHGQWRKPLVLFFSFSFSFFTYLYTFLLLI